MKYTYKMVIRKIKFNADGSIFYELDYAIKSKFYKLFVLHLALDVNVNCDKFYSYRVTMLFCI